MTKLRWIAAGAVAGVAGAALMGPVHMLAVKINPQRRPKRSRGSSEPEDPTEKVADAVAGVAGLHLRKPQRKKGGQIVHFAVGATMGALYGALAIEFPGVTAGAGTAFGAGVYLGAHAIAAPSLGLAPSPLENGWAQESAEFASHLVYGLVTDGVHRALRGRH